MLAIVQGQVCRIRKLQHSFENEQNRSIIIEGILESCDANSGHLILAQAIILKVHGADPFSEYARSELVKRADRASVNMEEVKECRFMNLMLTRSGIQKIERKQEQLPMHDDDNAQRDVVDEQLKLKDSNDHDLKVLDQLFNPAAVSNERENKENENDDEQKEN